MPFGHDIHLRRTKRSGATAAEASWVLQARAAFLFFAVGVVPFIGLGPMGSLNAADAARHWAFLPVIAGQPPAVKRAGCPLTAIDHFILARLETKGLKPASPATREQLIRRVSFDLVGLPPSPDDVAAFVNDRSPAAWTNLVERLLASPHYGERW